jgi:hypothetical protein
LCAASPPKLGDTCPKDPGADFRCEYTIDECVQGESTYPVVQYYCCFEGTWNTCGGNKTPCDDNPPEPGEDDGGTDARDAGAEVADAPGDK